MLLSPREQWLFFCASSFFYTLFISLNSRAFVCFIRRTLCICLYVVYAVSPLLHIFKPRFFFKKNFAVSFLLPDYITSNCIK